MATYLLALGSNLSFAFGAQFYTHYTKRYSAVWVNIFKALVCAFFCFITVLATGIYVGVELKTFFLLFASGMLGLGIGDIFLLSAFGKIGAGRTMALFGFDPIIVGFLSYFIFGQTLSPNNFFAILCFILCLLIFSIESFKASGHWDFSGIILAILGMLFDASGIILTRLAFDNAPTLSAFEGNFYRAIGALFFLFLYARKTSMNFFGTFKEMPVRTKGFLLLGAFFGTYVSLAFYLSAIPKAHLATLTGLSITSVIFSSIFECIWEKKWPTIYLISSIILLALGLYMVLFR